MLMKKLRRFYNTLIGRVSLPLTLVVLICLVLIIGVNIRIYQVQKKETLTYAQMYLENCRNEYSAQLDTMSAFYQSMFANHQATYQQLKKPVNEAAFHMAATQMLQDMDDVFFGYSGIAMTYCYIAERDYLIQSSTHPNYETSESLKRYIRDSHGRTPGNVFTQSTWYLAEVDGMQYLFNSIRQQNIEIGVVLECTGILRNTHILDDYPQGILYLTDDNGGFLTGIRSEDGNIVSCSPPDTDGMLHIRCMSRHVPAELHLLLPENQLLDPLRKQIVLNISVLLAGTAAMFWLVIYLFYRFTAKPVEDIAAVAKGLGSGELGQRLPETGQITEISEINHNFNELITAITALKIDLYEEKLRHQEAELAQLRLQLNPHLLLNSLNLVYTMTRQQHYEVAMQFTMCLIRHFRFVLKKVHHFVPLSEELDFCENYMEILSLQYPSSFFYEISLSDEELRTETLLPPLSIENLIENAVKYGLTQEKPLHIGIKIGREDRNGLSFTTIDIRDDGPGYSEEALAYIHRIQDGTETRNIASDGVGLKNLIERLRILYEGNAELEFRNDGGARIRMAIPSVWPQK